MEHTPAMHHAEVLIVSGTLALLFVPALVFLVRVFPQRRTRAQLWQNGLYFALPFFLFTSTWLFTYAFAIIALIAAVVTAFIPSTTAKHIMWLSLGELVASLVGITMLGLLNTYAVPQR